MAIAAPRSRPATRALRLRAPLSRLPSGVWALLAVALLLRLALVAATYDTPLTLDPADFSRNGLSLAQGHGIPPSNRAPAGGPSAFRPPGYPLFLAGVYATARQEAAVAARAVQALLGTIAAGLIGLIAARIWGRRVGLIALGVAALAPPLVIMSTALVSEALFVPLVLAAVAAALEARRSSRPLSWALVVGVLLGAAELTRTNAAVLLLTLALAVWKERPRWRPRALLAPAAVALAAVVTVAPWTVRNALALRAFVPVSTEVGYTLAGTYNLASRSDHHWPAVWKEAEHGASPEYGPILFYASIERWDERKLGDRLEAAALADIRRDPGYLLKVGWWNTVRMLHLGELDFAVANLRDTDIPRLPALLEIFGFYPLGVLALAGLATRQARRAPLWLWLVPVVLGSTIFVSGFIRFRSSLDPFLVMLAALAVAWCNELRRQIAERHDSQLTRAC
jgi:4-amino-4-deoxy-L-arabinose transferase-like glycosyltransferase